jgi:hypothetical protein
LGTSGGGGRFFSFAASSAPIVALGFATTATGAGRFERARASQSIRPSGTPSLRAITTPSSASALASTR